MPTESVVIDTGLTPEVREASEVAKHLSLVLGRDIGRIVGLTLERNSIQKNHRWVGP
jgi:hypothetical protein